MTTLSTVPAFFIEGLVNAFETVERGKIKPKLLEIDAWEQNAGLYDVALGSRI